MEKKAWLCHLCRYSVLGEDLQLCQLRIQLKYFFCTRNSEINKQTNKTSYCLLLVPFYQSQGEKFDQIPDSWKIWREAKDKSYIFGELFSLWPNEWRQFNNRVWSETTLPLQTSSAVITQNLSSSHVPKNPATGEQTKKSQMHFLSPADCHI